MHIGLIIILILVFCIVLYIIIEKAVSRGIDISETNELLRKISKQLEEQNKK
ncbi:MULTISPECIES: hypothetical protein [Bacillales]|uniref:Uncharacterized protein n=1 Tax=Lysinibacillus louembei TaxID=1470088 RepID=A0ABZ0RV51_9BACI|nr:MULTISPECIES: hypothetical protein [Bacillales]MCT6925357.1 hypothetical protein [Metasolibacillus sp.]MCT6941615.1 hypothetical protein [Metasolibacillus sp.]WPK11152.1 hypothetical protein R6U77_14835 [Lysinibacillus louembei]